MHDLEALGVGLHEAVLDAVVHHLDEMARARRAAVQPAVRRGEVRQRGRQVGDRLVGAADHQAVADLVAPDAAGGAGVDEDDAALGQRGRAPLAVGEARVAAVDEDVALAQQAGELVDRLLGDVARGHHDPDRAAPLAEVRDELLERRRRLAALARRASRAGPRSGSRRAPRGRRRAGGASCRRPCARVRRRRSSCADPRFRDVLERPLDRRLAGGHGDARQRAGRGRAARRRRRAPARRAACGSRTAVRGSPRRPARPPAAARTARSAARPCGTGRSSAGSAGRSRP